MLDDPGDRRSGFPPLSVTTNHPGMLQKNTITLPVSAFSFSNACFSLALSQVSVISWGKPLLIFLILPLFLHPVYNGYYSYRDRDVGSIALLKHPPMAIIMAIANDPILTYGGNDILYRRLCGHPHFMGILYNGGPAPGPHRPSLFFGRLLRRIRHRGKQALSAL